MFIFRGESLNLASALLKQVILLQDFETWSNIRKDYLPLQYHTIFSQIEKHSSKYHKLPTFEDLELNLRDSATLEKLYAIQGVEVEADAYMLLEYLKNEFTQREILGSLEKYVENSVSFEDAEESVAHLHQIVLDIEDKVDLQKPEESMQRISLFDSDEDLAKFIPLGLNADFDFDYNFSPTDLVLIGGRRGAGKSITCANIAHNIWKSGRSALYFTIEMPSRQILHRLCSIATGVDFTKVKTKNLSVVEWFQVAEWWSSRFVEGQTKLEQYKQHRDFDVFHHELTSTCELLPTQQLDVIYDPSLTLSRIRAELDKKVEALNTGVVLVDYINQVKRNSIPSRSGQFDWTEQIEVSKALKGMAQEYNCTVISPYQIDATGEARFAKGILDAADAAYTLDAHTEEDACMSFKCEKIRNAGIRHFTSEYNRSSLRIGPNSALAPSDRKEEKEEGPNQDNIFEI